VYAEKADARRGGVGAESQIISAEVYARADQQKFVPVATEISEDGAPYLPSYLKGRIYIDMTNPASRYERFEQLVRWLFDKPLHQRPSLGKPPAFIVTPDAPQLGTTARFRMSIDAIRSGHRHTLPLFAEYLETFATNLEAFRIGPVSGQPFDDAVVASIESFMPYRDEFVDLLHAMAKYEPTIEVYDAVHSFFESVLLYKYPPEGRSAGREIEFDNYKFILHELFLYSFAVLLHNRRYEGARALMEQRYFIPAGRSTTQRERLVTFKRFRDYVRTLEETRNERLKLGRLSVVADMLKQRSTRPDVTFLDLMQADFVLHLFSVLHFPDDKWFPGTLIYASHGGVSFELFARAISRRSFEHLKTLLNVSSRDELLTLFKQNAEGFGYHQMWEFDGINPLALMNAEKLANEA
jgi:hypothetical protein